MNEDLEHLRLLSIFHYVMAALTALFTLIPVVQLLFGMALSFGWGEFEHDAPPAFVGWLLSCIAGVLFLLGGTYAVCLVIAGRSLARHRNWVFCMVIAGISCTFMPVGTVLGVFTMVVLNKPSVRALFEGRPGPPAVAPSPSV